MSVPFSQMWTVASYVLKNQLRGVKRYPLVLMLEPLFRCNLACAGCGKIQFPAEILRKNLSPEQCWKASDECGAPIVAIPGGEPLLHPQIEEIVAGLVKRKRYVYLCTNALKLEESLPRFKPSRYFSFSVHLDGPQPEHDAAVCREGTYDIAIQAIKAAKKAGFRVTTNSTFFAGTDAERMRGFFDEMTKLGLEGMMISPGYSYEKAPDQEHFLGRKETISLFQRLLRGTSRGLLGQRWQFNQSPLFLEFLQGKFDLECTPWGSPTYNVFGWQKPCYLLGEGYTQSFKELLETTAWENYGRKSGNSKCQDCLMHCGYEPSAVAATFGSWAGFWRSARLAIFGDTPDVPASQNVPRPHLLPESATDANRPSGSKSSAKSRAPLVQISSSK